MTDRRRTAPQARTEADQLDALERLLDEALEAAVDLIQIRERDLHASTLRGLVARVVRRAESTATRVLVNDRADVAAVAGADGVHLRDDGAPVGAVRSCLPAGALVGRSVHTADRARHEIDIDYAVFGPVYQTSSKPPDWTPTGLDALSATTAAAPVPVLAIGGITTENFSACLGAGAAGMAAIGLFIAAASPRSGDGLRAAVDLLRRAERRPGR